MTVRKYTSRSQQTTLSASITSGATVMTVNSANSLLAGIGNISAGPTFTVVIDPDTPLEEIIDVTAYTVNNNTLTITRAVDGSSAQDHTAGAIVRHMIIGRDLREANTHSEASAGVHGLASTSSVVGTIDAQDLSNKNIDMTGKTLTGLSSSGMVASSAAPKNYVDSILGSATAASTSAASAATSASSAATSASSAATSASSAATSATSAANSASAAATSASSAATSATSAATSATSAAASATTASNSATTATTQAAAASTSATSAAASATSAANSASAAATSATSSATSASSAATSATSAAASATTASNSASAAATSATSAAASATSAANSASAAATSATSAAASATSAANSASAAATSATSAATSATSAAASATAAASSATAAATSASSAATSATAAASSATAAATSATSAANSATAAATSATSAAASATSAANSASAAATSASSAATSASSAATSASSAATSATSAATSATSAATSASSASTTYDAYDQRYLGSKSSAPTVDNKGNALITGATYWNSTTSTMYAWTGSAWSAISTYNAYSAPTLGSQIISSGTTYTNINDLTINSTTIPTSKTLVDTNSAQTLTSKTLTSPTITSATLSLAADPSSALDAVTKQYADNIAAGLNAHDSVQAATTSAVTGTYTAGSTGADGGTGVGAYFTVTATGAFVVDGYTTVLNDRILLKNQSNAIQNGIYKVTTAGTSGVSAVLTRATDYDNSIAGEVFAGDTVFVTNGSTNINQGWLMNSIGTSTNPTKGIKIGTDNISWTQFTGTGGLTAGTGISISSNTISIDSTVATLTGSQTLTNKTISGTSNTITNVSLTAGVTGTLPLANGGTGATTQAGAANAVLPSQATNSGKYLTTDGSNVSWGTVSSYTAPTLGTTVVTSGTTITSIVGLSKLTSDAFMVKNSSSNEIDIAVMNIMGAW